MYIVTYVNYVATFIFIATYIGNIYKGMATFINAYRHFQMQCSI